MVNCVYLNGNTVTYG